MIRRFLALFRRKPAPPPPVERDLAIIIAKRGLRMHNRDAKGAAKFERVHSILSEGLK